MAAAVLLLPTIAHAQPSEGRGLYHRDELKTARDDVRASRKFTPQGPRTITLYAQDFHGKTHADARYAATHPDYWIGGRPSWAYPDSKELTPQMR
jgi:hypothetical protein